jgi:hypothetical protein
MVTNSKVNELEIELEMGSRLEILRLSKKLGEGPRKGVLLTQRM